MNGYAYVSNNPVRYNDPSGKIGPVVVGLLICGGGAFFGLGGQGIGDYIRWQGQQWSNWETYAGSALAGCVATVGTVVTKNPVLSNAIGGATQSITKQTLENVFQPKCYGGFSYDVGDIIFDTTTWGATAWALGKIVPPPVAGGLGDLTPAERAQIQRSVDEVERPLWVVGSAARGTRRGIGTNLPIGKGPGTRSDIDYLVSSVNIWYFTEEVERRLPSIDPAHGVILGVHESFMGPGIRFEPFRNPFFIPGR